MMSFDTKLIALFGAKLRCVLPRSCSPAKAMRCADATLSFKTARYRLRNDRTFTINISTDYISIPTRPGVTGGHSGAVPPQMTSCAPPNENCASPSEDCAPKKLTGLGLLGCKSRPRLSYFRNLHNIDGMKTFFFFFFWDHLFWAGKTIWISDFGRKIPLNLWSSSCSIDPDWDKFLVPPCPSRIHINKLLVPPQNLFLPPPVTLSWRRAWFRLSEFCFHLVSQHDNKAKYSCFN